MSDVSNYPVPRDTGERAKAGPDGKGGEAGAGGQGQGSWPSISR